MYENMIPQGPLFKTQYFEVAGTGTYVEVRQERWASNGRIGWEIEQGTLRYGFAGMWGRDNVKEATQCAANAISFQANRNR